VTGLSQGPVAPDPLAVTLPIGYPAGAEKDMTGSVVRSLPFQDGGLFAA